MNTNDDTRMDRRRSLGRLGALGALGAGSGLLAARGVWAQSTPDAATLLRAGACVLMLRHAQTDPGIGDPPNFNLAQCSTQRNLSEEGRAQARRIGQWFTGRGLRPRAVQSSPWCRCKDTADLAFGGHTVLPALASTFDNSSSSPSAQTSALRALLAAVPAGQFEVWVTHQVNISALTGEGPSMGEAVIVASGGKMLVRTRFG